MMAPNTVARLQPLVAISHSPMDTLRPQDMRPVPVGCTLADCAPATDRPLLCQVVGVEGYILREQWAYALQPGDIVVWHIDPPQDKEVFRTFLQIAAIFSAIVPGLQFATPYLLAASAAYNLLVPPTPQMPYQQAAPGNVYNTSLQGNQARLDQPIWKICGRRKINPPFAAEPYFQFIDDDGNDLDNKQFFYAVFAVGVGNHSIEQALIGGTPISHFADVLVSKYLAPGVQPSSALATVNTSTVVNGQILESAKYVGGFAACRAQRVCAAIGIDIVATRGLGKAGAPLTVAWRVEARSINDFGEANTAWSVIGKGTKTAATNTPQRWSQKFTLASAARVEVRVVRTDIKDADTTALHEIAWTGMRAYLDTRGAPVAGAPVTIVATPKRMFFWYEPATAVSTFAYLQDEYETTNQLSGSREYRATALAPSGKYFADVRPDPVYTTAAARIFTDSGGLPKLVSAALPGLMALEYDPTTDDFYALGARVPSNGAALRLEHRIALSGALSSSTTIYDPTVNDSQQCLAKFLGAWRVWTTGAACRYGIRGGSGIAVWSISDIWVDGSTTVTGTVVGALTLQSAATLVVAKLDYDANSPSASKPQQMRMLRTTDGTTWAQVAYIDLNTANATISAANANAFITLPASHHQMLVPIGTAAAYYFQAGLVTYVMKSDATGATWTTSKCTINGVACDSTHSPQNLVGNSTGSHVIGRITTYNAGSGSYDVSMVSSTNGIDFTTISAATLVNVVGGVTYTPAALDILRPLFCDGTRFLYERNGLTAPATVVQVGSYLPTPALLNANTAHYEVVLRASDQLSQISQRDIALIVQASARSYVIGTGWLAEAYTRTPAWWALELASSAVWGLGLPDARIDFASFVAFAATNDARQDRFDHVFDSALDAWSALQLIARAGRARVFRRNGMLTIARDEQATLGVTAYTPRNTVPHSMVVTESLPQREMPDGFVVEYCDLRTWLWTPVNCPCPGVGTMVAPIRKRLEGITGPKHAQREGLYEAANLLYRRRVATCTTEMQGQLPAFMSAVRWLPDIPNYGQSGDVCFWDLPTRVMGLSEPPDWTVGDLYLTLIRDDGSLTLAVLVTPGATAYDITLPAAPDFALVLNDGTRERPKYLLGTVTGDELMKVSAIKDGGVSAEGAQLYVIEGVVDDPRVHAVDAALLPTLGEVQDAVTAGDSGSTGGGSLLLVSLSPHTIEDGGVATSNTGVAFLLNNNGTARSTNFHAPFVVDHSGEWMQFGAIEVAQAALYEVRATYLGGTYAGENHYYLTDRLPGMPTLPTAGSAIGSWLNLGTSRTWELTLNIDVPPFAVVSNLLIEIRDVATATVQASAAVTLFCQTINSGVSQ